EVNNILNMIDGVDTKSQEIVCVFTSNHPERISSAFKRAGRLDAVVEVRPPDQEAASRLIARYGRFHETADLEMMGRALAGRNAASIREAIERSKLVALGRSDEEIVLITNEDFEIAMTQLEDARRLMEYRPPRDPSALEHGLTAFGKALSAG